jgi:hypothetical protein
MTAQVRSLGANRWCLVLLVNAAFTVAASAAIIDVQLSQLGAYAHLSYASSFGSGWGQSLAYGPGLLIHDKVRGNAGAGAAHSYALDWNGPVDVGNRLEVFMAPWQNPVLAVGYAVDPAGSSFSSESRIRSHAPPWSLLIEPSEAEVPGMPVLVQIDTRIRGQISACGAGAIAEAQFSTISDGGPLLDESLSVIGDGTSFDFARSQTFESAIGEEFTLQFDHRLAVSGEYGAAGCAASARLRDFELTATVTIIPEPASLVTVGFGVLALLAWRTIARR